MEVLNEDFVSKTHYEELEGRHQLQYGELERKHQELKRMLYAVLNAKKEEPTEETEEEYVKPPVLETRVLHIQEEQTENVT